MAKSKSNKKNERNPILGFLFAIVIPVIVALILTVVILSVAGINVVDWVKDKGSNIPVVSSFITTKEEKSLQDIIGTANETIEKQKEHIDMLNEEVSSLENIVDDLEIDIKKLENKNNSEEQLTDGANDDGEVDTVKQTASSFRKMEPESAADILNNMDESLAVNILSSLSGEVRGSILAEMEPKKAAQLTTKMAAN